MYMTDRWYVAAPHERTNLPSRGASCRAIGVARVHGLLLSEFSHLPAIAWIRVGCRRQSRTHGCPAPAGRCRDAIHLERSLGFMERTTRKRALPLIILS